MPNTFKITGGNPLSGSITPVPNKNSILPAIAASVLTDKSVILRNIPKTTDVDKMLDIIKKLGGVVERSDKGVIKIDASGISSYTIDYELGSIIRASILFVGPLLARFKKARFPMPGGCELGKRSINTHLDGFSKVGITYEYEKDYILLKAPKKADRDYRVWFIEASVTATENLILYCTGIDSNVEITEAASEPHISQLLDISEELGAEINGKGSNKITVKGKSTLKSYNFVPLNDHVDVAAIIAAAAITKGKIKIKNSIDYDTLGGIKQFYSKWGLVFKDIDKDLMVDGTRDLYLDPFNSGFPLAGDDLPKVNPKPWPGFPVDALPPVVTMACKNEGKVMFNNWMYETGLNFVTILNTLGANIYIMDPHRVIVNGPVRFKGGKVRSPHVIQATKAIFLAALADPVETILEEVDILKRRYPDIIDKYTKMGANIKEI